MRRRDLGWALGGLLAVGSVLADVVSAAPQAPPVRSRVTIASRPAPLPPPSSTSSRVRRIAAGGYDIQPWLDRSDAATSVPASGRGTFVLARDLALPDGVLAADTPILVILADSLRVVGNMTIDVSAKRTGAAGGSVMILARQITCEAGARLTIVANGAAPGGAGGALTIAPADARQVSAGGRQGGSRVRPGLIDGVARRPSARDAATSGRTPPTGAPAGGRTSVGPCISHTAVGGAGGDFTVRDHRAGQPAEWTRKGPAGAAGAVQIHPSIETAAAANPVAAQAASTWILERLEYVRLGIYAAASARNDSKVLEFFRQFEALGTAANLVEPGSRDAYREILKELITYRETVLAPLFVEDVTVRPGGQPQTVSVFTEGATLRSSIAPTHALAVRTGAQGRSVLGLLDYRNERPDELAIEIEWELTVDPWIEKLAAAVLPEGTRLQGVFSGWGLDAKPMQEMGVRSATATLLPGGRRLRARFVVDSAQANLVFWRLLNTSGLPWSVDWTYREPRTNRVVTGTWAGPVLSVARQRAPQITVADGRVTNIGTSALTIHYLRTGDASFVTLNPAWHIAPGESRTAVPEAGVSPPFTVPAEAVEVAFDPERFASDFYVLNGEKIVDSVVIRNALPTSDDQRGAFDYLEISVASRIAGASDADTATVGPFRLSASGTRGGEITLPMLRLTRGERQLTVTGRAYYVGGSYRTLTPTTFDSLTIAITAETFAPERAYFGQLTPGAIHGPCPRPSPDAATEMYLSGR
jgi:hypothetical protein